MTNLLSEDAALLKHHIDYFEDGARVLVTGASGLIGVNLLALFFSEEFVKKKIEVYVCVHSEASKTFLRIIFPKVHINFASLDLVGFGENELNKRFDYIFHLATYGQPGKFMLEQQETMRLNSIGLVKLFDYLQPSGRLFFASTSEVYSGNPNTPHIESEIGITTTTHPRACYIEAKRFGEAFCCLKAQAGVRAYSGRISLAYGPGFRVGDKRVLNEFIFNALRTGSIRMMDDGSALRVYCYVRDTIDMILRQIHSNHYEPLNIGGIEQISIIALANKVANNCASKVFPGKSAEHIGGAPLVVSSSTSLASKVLDKKSYVSMDEGIVRATNWGRYILSQ